MAMGLRRLRYQWRYLSTECVTAGDPIRNVCPPTRAKPRSRSRLRPPTRARRRSRSNFRPPTRAERRSRSNLRTPGSSKLPNSSRRLPRGNPPRPLCRLELPRGIPKRLRPHLELPRAVPNDARVVSDTLGADPYDRRLDLNYGGQSHATPPRLTTAHGQEVTTPGQAHLGAELNPHFETTAFAGPGLDVSAVGFDDAAAQGQAHAHPARHARAAAIGAEEGLEEAR